MAQRFLELRIHPLHGGRQALRSDLCLDRAKAGGEVMNQPCQHPVDRHVERAMRDPAVVATGGQGAGSSGDERAIPLDLPAKAWTYRLEAGSLLVAERVQQAVQLIGDERGIAADRQVHELRQQLDRALVIDARQKILKRRLIDRIGHRADRIAANRCEMPTGSHRRADESRPRLAVGHCCAKPVQTARL